jgi:hypothetical protein
LIECRCGQPRELDRAAVYWAVDRHSQVYLGPRIRGTDLALPKSWRILYRDGDEWRPVETEDPFTLRLDLLNEVSFAPVTTRTPSRAGVRRIILRTSGMVGRLSHTPARHLIVRLFVMLDSPFRKIAAHVSMSDCNE